MSAAVGVNYLPALLFDFQLPLHFSTNKHKANGFHKGSIIVGVNEGQKMFTIKTATGGWNTDDYEIVMDGAAIQFTASDIEYIVPLNSIEYIMKRSD